MDSIRCPTCQTDVPMDQTDILRFEAAGAQCEERRLCCPDCDMLILLAVTMAEEKDAPAVARSAAAG